MTALSQIGLPTASPSQLEEAIENAVLDRFVEQLPAGSVVTAGAETHSDYYGVTVLLPEEFLPEPGNEIGADLERDFMRPAYAYTST